MNVFYCLSAALGLMLFAQAAMGQDAFISAGEWEQPKAEIIRYEVRKTYLGKEIRFKAYSVLEGQHYQAQSQKVSRNSAEGWFPILVYSLNYSFTRDVYERNTQTQLLCSRQKGVPLVEEKVKILDWDNPSERKFHAVDGSPQLNVVSRKEGVQNYTFNQTPVYTAEQLFVYLRSLPLEKGYRENIWFLGPLTEEVYSNKPYTSEIVVQGQRVYRDKKVWFISVSGPKNTFYEFYLDVKGLHQVYYAKYPDNTIFQLEKLEWKRYWFF